MHPVLFLKVELFLHLPLHRQVIVTTKILPAIIGPRLAIALIKLKQII